MSDLAFNVSGTITGVIGILALIPAFFAWLQTRLPSTRLDRLLALLGGTQKSFAIAIRDGLFTDENELRQFNFNIWMATTQVDDIRAKVHGSTTWSEDVSHWWHGLSGQIKTLCDELNFIEAKLAKKNSRERKRLASQISMSDLPLMSDYQGHYAPSCCQKWASSPCSASLRCPAAFDGPPELQEHNPVPFLRDTDPWGPRGSRAQDALRFSRVGKAAAGVSAPFGRISSEKPTHHLVSDAELQDLLSFALPYVAGLKRQRGSRRSDVLTVLARQLFGPPSFDIVPGVPYRKRHAKHSRLRGLSRLVRRIYGVRFQDETGTNGNIPFPLDPETLTPPAAAGTSDRDGDCWEDV